MTSYTVALMEGDGIGPDVSAVALTVLGSLKQKFDLQFDITSVPAGDRCKQKTGEALPDSSIDAIRSSDVCLKAPVGETAAETIVRLRQILNLYANIRPSKTLPNVPSLKPNIDFVIVRENTEDLYRGLEFSLEDGIVALRTTTRRASERISRYAFQLAEQRNLSRRVVAVHKANVLKKGDGLFLQVCREVAAKHPTIAFSDMLVDSTAMNLIRIPETFDVLVMPNMYGDILSDEAAQLVGGLGLAPSANIGEDFALFEPVHGAAPDIAGKGIANPTAMILTTSMMLEWLAHRKGDGACADAASTIRKAVDTVLENQIKTPDLGGHNTTTEVGAAVARAVVS